MKSFYHLQPAYRHGKDTPWGGDLLRREFGLPIPDDRTGEALIASTLPGLESRTDDGRTLTDIAGGPLPLLLKLIDAREALSVQVHPDDAYAAAHEGKLGKTEAWVVLHTDPGAKLVYGLRPGTDVTALSGKEIEDHLRWLPVTAGDVLYIPAGMVHAIGGGILLYEIQQSSDVTYRFWDWGRTDKDGNPRALHWQAACDVARADLQLLPESGTTAECPGGSSTTYLQTPYFNLLRIDVTDSMVLPAADGFQYVTAMRAGSLTDGNESANFARGDTFYVPAGANPITINGPCTLLISTQGHASA